MFGSTEGRRVGVVATVTATLALVLALGPEAEARGDYWQKCGDKGGIGAGWFNVRAHSIGCHNARGVARRWWDSSGDNSFNGWTCGVRVVGYELAKTDCTRTRRGKFQRVKFGHGA